MTSLEREPVARTRCKRCGRNWSGIVNGTSADLGALMRLSPVERECFAACWTGSCKTASAAPEDPR